MPSKKLSKVTKSNDINQANFSDFSLSSYRVFLNLLTKLQHYDKDKNLIPLSLASRNCSLSASEYAEEFNIPQNKAYGILKTAVDHLLKTSYSIPFENGNIMKINICSQAYYRKNEGQIDVRFTEEIMPHLAGLSDKFTMYHLNDIAGFESIYTTRLWELLMQWQGVGELSITIEELRFALGCVAKFKLYADFKRKAFEHAVNEINSQYAINLTFEEVKTGKAVTSLIFRFKAVQQGQFYDVYQQKMRTKFSQYKKIKKPKSES